jgi:hypothetical protein
VWLYVPLFASFMMISDYPMLALKFKKGDPLNIWKFAIIFIGLLSVVVFGPAGVAVLYFVYIGLSFLANTLVKSDLSKEA